LGRFWMKQIADLTAPGCGLAATRSADVGTLVKRVRISAGICRKTLRHPFARRDDHRHRWTAVRKASRDFTILAD